MGINDVYRHIFWSVGVKMYIIISRIKNHVDFKLLRFKKCMTV